MRIRTDELEVGMRVKTHNPANNAEMIGTIEELNSIPCMSLVIKLDDGSVLSIPRFSLSLWAFEVA